MLPVDLRTKLDLHLYSELEGRVPQGSHQEFLSSRIREFFESETLDLAPYAAGVPPGNQSVRGSPSTIQLLKWILES